MKKLLTILTLILTACCLHAASIYVQDQTGWGDLKLYSYMNDKDALHGKWPGASPVRTETINGVVCPVFDFSPATAGNYYLIFNNGNGTQCKDFLANELRDYYLVVTPQGCTEVSRSDIKPEPEPEPTLANSYVVYQANEKIFASTKAFAAIEARLDEIASLGVNVLWLMPIHPIGTLNSVDSPYCIKDFKGINSAFGTLSDLQSLVDAAHSRGMKVILDWVANHSALDHPWVTAHPDWYGTPTGDEVNWKDIKPFDYSKTAMRAAMTDAMTYWINTADIDGFRCDFAQGVPDDYWQEAITAIRAIKPDAIMLAETSRTQLYSKGFDWMYSWNYLGAIQNLFTSGSLSNLYSKASGEMNSTPAGKERLRYITNHDACSERANQDCYTNTNGMLAAACLTYFLEGVPLIYSSQEIGYLQKIQFCCSSAASVKMNWNSNPDYQAKFRALMKAYTSTTLLRGGKQIRHTGNADVACFTYASTAGKLLVMVNIRNKSLTAAVPEVLRGEKVYNVLTGESLTLGSDIQMPAFGYYVLSTTEVPTAEETAVVSAEPRPATKILRNGQLIIMKDNHLYSIMGQKL